MRLFIANLIGLRSKSYLPRYIFNNLDRGPFIIVIRAKGKASKNERSSIVNRKIEFVFNL